MKNTAQPSPTYHAIDSVAALTAYAQRLLNDPTCHWIAIDTEFVRTDTYFAELSLVQIQDNHGEVAIIDPLPIQAEAPQNGLQGLINLLVEPRITKVFHSARQDLEVLYQLAQQMPVSIFDTQLAAIFFKHGDMAGFARVVEAELNHSLPKDQTRTNWHARPLSEEQLQYAIDDVRYLAPLYEKFNARLNALQKQALADDCAALLDARLYKPDPANAGDKIKGVRGFKPKQLAIVYALAEWRERYAIAHNQPKKWVMSDEIITAIAQRPPKTVEALYKVPQIKASSVKAFGEEWIACIDAVFAADPASWPQPEARPAAADAQEEVLISLCMALCHQIGLDYRLNPHNMVNKTELLALLRGTPSALQSGWRGALIGTPLQQLLNGEAALTVANNRLVVQLS